MLHDTSCTLIYSGEKGSGNVLTKISEKSFDCTKKLNGLIVRSLGQGGAFLGLGE
jgi:hypothetical protein